MSQPPPTPQDPTCDLPQDTPPLALAYATPPPDGSAPLLVRLAGIFTLVSSGIDLIAIALAIIMISFILYASSHPPPVPPGHGPPPSPPPTALFFGIYGVPACLSLFAMIFKTFGAIKLLKRGPRAWAWGLAAGIIGCCQFWMFMDCCLLMVFPMAAGIYTIIILSLDHVRRYLRTAADITIDAPPATSYQPPPI